MARRPLPFLALQPLQELCRFLEEQMGLPPGWLLRVPLTLLLYVSSARRIRACVAAEPIREAFHVHPRMPTGMEHGMHSCRSAAVTARSGGTRGGAQHAAAAQPFMAVATAAAIAMAEYSDGSGGGHDAGAMTTDGMHVEEQHDTAGCVCNPQQQEQKSVVAACQDAPQAGAASAGTCLVLDGRQPVRVVCGVRLMWVSLDARRQGLATRLLDCCRCQFMPGYVLPRHELAFRWVEMGGCDSFPVGRMPQCGMWS